MLALKRNSNEYAELRTRVKKFKRYERAFDILTTHWYIIFFIGFLYLQIVNYIFGSERELFKSWEFIALGFATLLVPVYITGKKMNKYRLRDDEWASFYTYSILNNLEKYSTTTNIEMKKDYRKKATKNAKDFLSCIKKRWKIGRFKLTRDLFGKPLSELKKNIEYGVIPSLEKGDAKSLGEVEQIMRNFHAESRNFNLKTINHANEQMSLRLETREGKRIGLRDRVLNFFSVHYVLKHLVVVSTFAIVCCIFYYMAVSHLQISKEVVFGSTIVLFIGLTTIYFRRKPTE